MTVEAVEAVEAPRIVVHGPESYFDLADLGPDFSETWMAEVLLVPMALEAGPALEQRVTKVATHEGDWSRQTRVTYVRQQDGRLRERRVERWDSTAWTRASRTTYTYRSRLLERQHTEVWSEGQWRPDHQLIFARDAEGRVRKVVHRTRRGSRWMNTDRLTVSPVDTSRHHALEAPGRRHRLMRETWADSTWAPLTRATFVIAEDGRHVAQNNETWTGQAWEASVRFTFMYDGAGYPIEETAEVWTGTGWAEGPLQLYDYEIDERRIVQRRETWVGSQRIRTDQTEFTYAAPLRAWILSEAP